jgi:5'-3' exonuclease, N-terminal resolvase-like domain
MTTMLIDADIVCFRCAASAEDEDLDIAIMRTDNMMQEILSYGDSYLAALSGKDNFRYKINPEYKANRVDKIKPRHLEESRSYVISEYKAITCNGYEADDFLGFNQTDSTIIASIDKDLLMIPGHHYNFVKREYTEASELDGLKQFYRQMLIGDSSDNIFGVKGIGKVKAAKLIDHLDNEEEIYSVVFGLYSDLERFNMNTDCLWIWRNINEKFSDRKMTF